MDRYATLLEELRREGVDFKIDSRKAKSVRAPVVRVKDADKTLAIAKKLKYPLVPSDISQSGQAYLVDVSDKFYLIVPGSNKGAQKKQLTPSNLGLTEKKFTSKSQFLEVVEKAIHQTELPAGSKTIASHLIRVAALNEKFNPKILATATEQEMNNFRNDFGEVLCGMDSLTARKAKEIWFPGKINAPFDYKEANTKMSVKGSRSSDVQAFGSGNSVSHIKEELKTYKTKTSKEAEIVKALLYLAEKDLYNFLNFLSNKLPTLKEIKSDPALGKHLVYSDSGLANFVAKFKTNAVMYKVLPDSGFGISKNTTAKPTKNSILFWLLTNVAKDINQIYGHEINNIGQIVYSDRGSIRLFIFSKSEFLFQTKTYKDFKIKFHYWGNEGSPLNNWPGLKVTKS